MKITIEIVKSNWQGPYFERRELECDGLGTEIDPVLIGPSEKLPHIIRLVKSNIFITIQNCDLPGIWLVSSQNVSIEKCNVRVIILEDSSKIFCIKSTIKKTIRLYSSHDVKIEKCNINKLKIAESNSNFIKNCTIKYIKEIRSKENIFEEIKAPEKQLNKLEKKSWFTDIVDKLKLKYLLVFILIYFAIVIFLPWLAFNSFLELHAVLIWLFIFINLFYLGEVIDWIRKKRMNKIT